MGRNDGLLKHLSKLGKLMTKDLVVSSLKMQNMCKFQNVVICVFELDYFPKFEMIQLIFSD